MYRANQQPVEKQQRVITCYQCGLSLGTVEVGWDAVAMAAFRAEAAKRREAHICGQGELPQLVVKPEATRFLEPPL